jgi:mannose-6-phosphate isomerase
MPLPPLRFEPLLKPRAWGGHSLAALGKRLPTLGREARIGESWEIADLAPPVPDGVSRVASGPFRGATLRDLMGDHRHALLGRAADVGGRFPLLVKYLDAAEHLSVQVHPTEAYAALHPGSHLKTEAWVVVAAEPGAAIFRGVRPGVDAATFRRAIADGTAVDCMVREDVRAGDCVALQSGLCHALGAGVLVAEVQTPSDTTFRVFDWNRNDPARPLHVDQALECILFGEAQGLAAAPVRSLDETAAQWSDGLRSASLCRTRYFDIELVEASPSGDAAPLALPPGDGPRIVMLLRGEAFVDPDGHRQERLAAGDTVLIPADCAPSMAHLDPSALLLVASIPTPGSTLDASLPDRRVA